MINGKIEHLIDTNFFAKIIWVRKRKKWGGILFLFYKGWEDALLRRTPSSWYQTVQTDKSSDENMDITKRNS